MTRQHFANRDGIEKRILQVHEDLRDESLQPLRKAVEYLEAHFDQSLTLEMLADTAKLSVSRLAHLFKDHTKTTLIEYLTWVRIRHAQRLLAETDLSCLKIANEVGYNNQSYFTRAFKRVVKATPRQYRKRGHDGKVTAKRM